MSGLVLLATTWISYVSYRNKYLVTGPLLVASVEPLAHRGNLAGLILFYSSYRIVGLVPFLYSCGRSSCYSDRLHDLSIIISRCYNDVYVNSEFSSTARLWNSLSTDCFPLT